MIMKIVFVIIFEVSNFHNNINRIFHSVLACCNDYGWGSKSIDIRFARQCQTSGQYLNISEILTEFLNVTDSKREIGGSRICF